MIYSPWALISLFFSLRLASAIAPPARWGTGCAYARQRIYCFAGSTWSFQAGTDASKTMNDLFYLDIAEDLTISSSGSAWVTANNTGSLDPETNFMFALTSIPTEDIIYINGGVGSMNDSLLINPSIAYNAKTESWNAMSGNSGLQTYLHSMVADSNAKTYVWGGVSDPGNGYIGVEFPRNMRILDFNNNQWTTVMLPNIFETRIYHVSVLGNDGKTIYFLGGVDKVQTTNDNGTTVYQEVDALFSEVLTFNTETSLWSTRDASGHIPTPRVLHAAALKPNTNEIVVYGGAYTNISLGTVPDFCVSLDTTSMAWAAHNLSVSAGAGARFGHGAVFPANSSMLFVMFGIDSNVYERTDFQVLDTNKWQWIDSYVGPGRIDDGTSNGMPQNPSSSDLSNGSLTGGSIAGVVVGCVAGICILAGVAFLFIRRRARRQSRDKRDNNYDMGVEKGNDLSPPFLVDVSDHGGPRSPPPLYAEEQVSSVFQQQNALSPSHIQGHQRSSMYSSTGEPTPETGYSAGSASETRLSSEGRTSFGIESYSTKPDTTSNDVPRMALKPVKPDGGS